RIWHLLPDRRNRSAVEVAEAYADGIIDEQQLDAANKTSYGVYENTSAPGSGFADAATGISKATWEGAQAATIAALAFRSPSDAIWAGHCVGQQAALAASCCASESHPAGA